jgi:hypothetical protein
MHDDEQKMLIPGTYLELADNHKTYLELLNLVCYLDDANYNGRIIPYGTTKKEREHTEAMIATLKDMPVYAKITKNRKGEPTFKGHEMRVASNGEITFDTIPIGTHTKVWVENREVTTVKGETKTLPCVMASQRIWKRNRNAVEAIKRLFAAGKLHNSWEIETSVYEFKDGLKYLKEYVFEGNCFLADDAIGGGSEPAYGESSAVLSVASQEEEPMDCEKMIAEALCRDLEESEVNEQMEDEKVMEQVVTEASEAEVPVEAEQAEQTELAQEQAETEVAMSTERDIRIAIMKAFQRRYVWLSFLFPEDHKAWFRDESGEAKELDYIEVSYEVDEAGNVRILDEQPVTMVATPREMPQMLAEKDQQIAERDAQLAEKETKIGEMQTELSNLQQYKELYDKAEAEKAEAKRQSEIAELRTYVEQAECFTQEEMAELAPLIEKLEVSEVKARVADKLMSGKLKTETSSVMPRRSLEDDEGVFDSNKKTNADVWNDFIRK